MLLEVLLLQRKQVLLKHRVKKGSSSLLLVHDPILSFSFSTGKDTQPVEILPDEPEPFSFTGQLIITGISLTCRLITTQMQQTELYRLLQLPSLTHLSMPLPILPVLQSGLAYPGKQSLIKYFMLIPTPQMVHNEEVDDVHSFVCSSKIFHRSSGYINFIILLNSFVSQSQQLKERL